MGNACGRKKKEWRERDGGIEGRRKDNERKEINIERVGRGLEGEGGTEGLGLRGAVESERKIYGAWV